MPKAKPGLTPEERKQRFIADAQSMIDGGSLSPTDAEKLMDRALRSGAKIHVDENR